jgi:hypothetical protein
MDVNMVMLTRQLRNLSLSWKRRGKKVVSDREKVILDNVSAVFPGEPHIRLVSGAVP